MIRARVGAAATVGAALLLAMVNATGASAATAPVSIGSNEIQRSVEPGSVSAYVSSTTNASHLPAGYVPSASSLPVSSSSDAKTVITGLNMRDQRNADNGNQFSLEPPDQGLCVGGNLVLESVNTVFRIHNTATGTSSDTISLNEFYTGSLRDRSEHGRRRAVPLRPEVLRRPGQRPVLHVHPGAGHGPGHRQLHRPLRHLPRGQQDPHAQCQPE